MNNPDLLLIVATATLTAAVCILIGYGLGRARRRTLTAVRAQRDRLRAELWELRAARAGLGEAYTAHVDRAMTPWEGTVADPIPYTVVDPADRNAYLPVFTPGRVAADLDAVDHAVRNARTVAR